MTHMKHTLIALAALASTLAAQAAPLQNAGFSAGLASWSTAGDASDAGTSTLHLTTASLEQDDAPFAAGARNLSGTSAALAGQPNGPESVLGIAPGALGDYATEGSAAAQSFDVVAGQTISFDWQLVLSWDAYAGSGLSGTDSAWMVWGIDGALTPIQLGDISTMWQPGLGTAALGSISHIDLVATSTGTARLGWAVMDVGDTVGTTWLSINNLSVSAAPTPAVPEPESLALVLTGLVLLGHAARRAHQS
jgi:hypothetical protein